MIYNLDPGELPLSAFGQSMSDKLTVPLVFPGKGEILFLFLHGMTSTFVILLMNLAKKGGVELLPFTPLPGIRNSQTANTCEMQKDIPTTPPYLPQLCRCFEAVIQVN